MMDSTTIAILATIGTLISSGAAVFFGFMALKNRNTDKQDEKCMTHKKDFEAKLDEVKGDIADVKDDVKENSDDVVDLKVVVAELATIVKNQDKQLESQNEKLTAQDKKLDNIQNLLIKMGGINDKQG